jgi:hypothetical protein
MRFSRLDQWLQRHHVELADRDLARELNLPFLILRSNGTFKTIYLKTGLILDATDAEIILWFHCKELYLRHYGRFSQEALNAEEVNFA